MIGKKDKAIENRYRIIRALLNAGADMNKTRKETNMTAMHWLAHNNDPEAIKELLNSEKADHLILSHDNNLPIDIAGTTPSLESVDVFLEHYAAQTKLQKAQVTKKCENIVDAIMENNGPLALDELEFEEMEDEPRDTSMGEI